MKKIDQYYVIGNPVKHSLSPKIHTYFAHKTDQNIQYEALTVEVDRFKETMDQLKQNGISGLSVTVPFKENMCQYVDELDDFAKQAQAVSNVIVNEQNEWIGLNLDGLGLVNDIEKNHHISFKNKNILILGAGGATRGILAPIFAKNPKSITIANRTVSKAETLATDFSHLGIINAISINNIENAYDIVINATSMSINNNMPNISVNNFTNNSFGYDLMYAPQGTIFTLWCEKNHIQNSDGKGMLLELSKEAFYRWRHIRVDDINPI
jgi:shikimate dehydrogenase